MAKNLKFNVVKFSENVTSAIDRTNAGIGKVLSAPQTLTDQLNKKTGLNIALPSVPPINQNLRGIVNSAKELAKNPGGVAKNGISAASSFAKSQLKDIAVTGLTNVVNNVSRVGTETITNTFAGSNGGTGSINLKNGITNAVNTNLSAAANNIGGSITGAVNNTISGTINNVSNDISKINKNIKTSLGGIVNNNINGIVNNVQGGLNGFVNAGFSNINGVSVNSVRGAVQGGIASAGGTVSGIITGGVSTISSAAGGFAKAQFGNLSASVTGNLNQLKGTLRTGIRNCLRSSITGLVRSISAPNLSFGGISLNVQDFKTPDLRVAVSGVINNQVQAGVVAISKKFNKFISAEITLQGAIINKKLNFSTNLNVRFNALKNVKSSNYYTAKMTSEVNKSINKICNTLTPRNKKALARGGALMNNVANAASDIIINNVENQIVKAASGFSAKAPSDFFNKATGKVSATIDKSTGLVSAAGEKIGSTVGTTVDTVTSGVQSGVTKTYNNIKDSISSNVAKLKG